MLDFKGVNAFKRGASSKPITGREKKTKKENQSEGETKITFTDEAVQTNRKAKKNTKNKNSVVLYVSIPLNECEFEESYFSDAIRETGFAYRSIDIPKNCTFKKETIERF